QPGPRELGVPWGNESDLMRVAFRDHRKPMSARIPFEIEQALLFDDGRGRILLYRIDDAQVALIALVLVAHFGEDGEVTPIGGPLHETFGALHVGSGQSPYFVAM